jgi:hypothetical protein
MSDLTAGSLIRALDTPPTVTSEVPDTFNFTNTAYATTGQAGGNCGVAFMAPTTGRVLLKYGAQIINGATPSSIVAPVIREGGTVGSGTSVLAAADDNAVSAVGATGGSRFREKLVTGLTPGATYNVRLEHRVSSASTGSVLRRVVIVAPST